MRLHLESETLRIELDEAEKDDSLRLAGCYVIETDVPKNLADTRTVHVRYRDLALRNHTAVAVGPSGPTAT